MGPKTLNKCMIGIKTIQLSIEWSRELTVSFFYFYSRYARWTHSERDLRPIFYQFSSQLDIAMKESRAQQRRKSSIKPSDLTSASPSPGDVFQVSEQLIQLEIQSSDPSIGKFKNGASNVPPRP